PLGEVAAAEGLELLRDGHGVRLADELVETAEQHHARERRDEPGDADVGDPPALPGADDRADAEPEHAPQPPRDAPVTDADGEDEDVGVAVEQVLRVARREDPPARRDLEVDDQGEEREEHAELARSSAQQLLDGRHRRWFLLGQDAVAGWWGALRRRRRTRRRAFRS